MKRVTITEGQVLVEGFSNTEFMNDELGSCREVRRAGLAWALKRLANEIELDLLGDWEKQTTCVD